MYNGVNMMKYSLNHFWKFKSPMEAYMSGLLQVSVAALITLINYFVILQSEHVLDLAKDFIALMIIADFDNAFAQAS